ncbi:SWIM zinc finger family protein [Longimycelium tulufanense]|nr:SWIM zinc finger family protein [Longimycelium tulufanense]
MPLALPCGIDLASVEEAVRATFYDRGVQYVRQGRVVRSRWDGAETALQGEVVGRGAVYSVTVYFVRDDDESLVFEEGDCSCPVGFNCKHVAALVVAVSDQPRGTPKRSRRPLTWEESLGSVLASGSAGSGVERVRFPWPLS